MNTRRSLTALLALAALFSGVAGTGSSATGAPAATTGSANPLVGGPWGVYTGTADGVYPAYQRATGMNKQLLAKVALRPRVRWFGTWIPTGSVQAKVRSYVVQEQAGNPQVLVQLATFRLWPHGEGHKSDPMTVAQQADYRHWVDQAALGIGSARTALVLEPDLGVALTGWNPPVRLRLAAYAARVFAALPHTSVYIDSSDADWLPVSKAVPMLLHAGVRYARGFALGATHYSSVSGNIAYARQVAAGLAHAGVPGKHAVIDTADNGRGFTWGWYRQHHPTSDPDNALTCRTRTQTHCDTLGIPPTWHTAAPGLVDGYLWFGRPWLIRQASPFSLARTLAIARTTPYPGP